MSSLKNKRLYVVVSFTELDAASDPTLGPLYKNIFVSPRQGIVGCFPVFTNKRKAKKFANGHQIVTLPPPAPNPKEATTKQNPK